MSYLGILADKNLIPKEELSSLEARMLIAPDEVMQALTRKGVSSEDMLRARGEYYGLPTKSLKDKNVPLEILKYIPKEAAINYKIIPLAIKNNILDVGIIDPENIESRDALSFIAYRSNLDFKTFLIEQKDFEKAIKAYEGITEEVGRVLEELQVEIAEEETQAKKKRVADEESKKMTAAGVVDGETEAPVTKIVATIIRYAAEGNASDIHIEPTEDRVQVRFRLDGVLSTSLVLPVNVHRSVVSRIKVLSDIKIDERRRPQDGRFSAKISGRKIDFRVSTFPTSFGEKVVIRILDQEKGIKKMEELGLRERDMEQVRAAIKRPYGLIIISGPTGSGKSTTLYAMLQEIDRDKSNVISLEDPIEYNIAGVSQSQVLPEIGYTFATGLRHTLRQDPDIIMVGEIRDRETAQLAIQAALTGHLVLSTLHTNNAIGVVPRLVDMGIDPYLIAPTLILTIAQRLVRKLCSDSGKKIPYEGSLKIMVEKQFSDLPEELKKSELPEKLDVYGTEPSAACPAGTRGRVGVFEVLTITKEIEALILKEPTDQAIWKIARRNGMTTMREDAFIKSFHKIVPFEEVNTL